MPLDRKKIALLHVGKARLGIGDDDWRALLGRVAGVASSRDLDDFGFQAVMSELERLGFQSTASEKNFGRVDRHWTMATPAQLHKIRTLAAEFFDRAETEDQANQALETWLRNRFRIGGLRMLDGARAQQVIGALVRMNQRKRADAAKESADA